MSSRLHLTGACLALSAAVGCHAADPAAAQPAQPAQPAARSGGLQVLARHPAGVLVGDQVVTMPEHHGDEAWSLASLASGATRSLPAPVRLIRSSEVGRLAENIVDVGDVLVAHDGSRPLIVRQDGTVARGTGGGESILGAAASGESVIVWWRLDASRTELEALDASTARPRWQREGPAWAWNAQLIAQGAHVALFSGAKIAVFDAASGASVGGFAIDTNRDVGWPYPFALAGGQLLVAAPDGILVTGLADGAQRKLSSELASGLFASQLVADDREAYAVFGNQLVQFELARGARSWAIEIPHATGLHLLSRHLVLCDADGGAHVIARRTGATLLRLGTGRCRDARERPDGTLAIAGSGGTWVVGPAVDRSRPRQAPARVVEGVVILDGLPAAGLPVLVGATSYPLDGTPGCPPVPDHATCVLTDARGRFRVTVRARGWLPITVDGDAAARRAGRPRAVGGSVQVDLDAGTPATLRIEIEGSELEL